MQPNKTDQARQALQSHAGPLSMRERRALILCDGRRDLKELTALLGADAPALIMHLYEAGYLGNTVVEPVAKAPASLAARTSAAAPIPVDAPAPVPTPAPAAQTQATGTRRSLVAAKLYLIGMLELQRDESAVAQRKQLQACQDPDAIVAHLLAGVHCLQRIASSSLAQRVRERLSEVLPESYLPALERLDLAVPQSSAA
ncbi:hypothetical protein CSC74_12465 [Pseudoxanthomonas yeongjuensis]|uniref:hypothetical protein n=1 Tax=Pseudoxanthomonas yeongjuensis TaxID=377616 RepID=UPI001391D5BE|nr:hypothetical protein [Pseudoxanthomonas yeongjuensis]KAF1715977.1 hypothetical protein CSC74_12465 [Pseudoxanthomonas yeongjuensis]